MHGKRRIYVTIITVFFLLGGVALIAAAVTYRVPTFLRSPSGWITLSKRHTLPESRN